MNFCYAKFPEVKGAEPFGRKAVNRRKFCYAEVTLRRGRNSYMAANSRSDSRIWNKSFSSWAKLYEADLRLRKIP